MGVPGRETSLALIGRQTELTVLRSAVEDAARGRMRAVLIEGEAGIGKTRLTTEGSRVAEHLGFRVVWGACDEMERDRPLRAFIDVPDLRPTDSFGQVDAAWVIVQRVVDSVEDMAATAPCVLVIEDLQWADPLTMRVVHGIARHVRRVPLVLVVTARPVPRGGDGDRAMEALQSLGAEHIVLGALDDQDVTTLAGAVAEGTPGRGLLDQVGRAGGNPLFVIELVRALQLDGALEVRDGVADAVPVSPPPTLRLTLLRRLSQLPDEASNLLQMASVLGSTFAVAELTRLVGGTSAQLLPALAAAIGAGVLTESGDRLRFQHELVRDVLYHDLPLSLRKSLHRDVVVMLLEAGASVERLASHVVLGAASGDTRALTWLQQAATETAGQAPATALRLLSHALDIADIGSPQRLALQAQTVAPLLAVGRRREAEAMAREVLAAGPDATVEVIARTGLASALSTGGRYPDAIDELGRAALAAPESAHCSLDAARSLLMVLNGDLDDAHETGRRAVEAGEREGDDYALCQGLQSLAMAHLAAGFVSEAVTAAERAVEVAERSNSTWATNVVPHLWHGAALCDADRFTEAATVLRSGQHRAEQSGNVARLPVYHWAIADLRLNAGLWDDAITEAQAGLDLVGDTDAEVGDVFASALCAHVAFHRGDLEAAQAAIDEAHRRLVAGPIEIGFEFVGWLAALLLEAAGRPSQALCRLADTWDLVAPVRYLQPTIRAMAPDLVRMAKAGGDQQRAVAVTEELERSATRCATPSAHGLALRCRGLVDNDVHALIDAVAAHREGPRPFLLAAACEDAGVACGRIGRTSDAIVLVGEAAATYHQFDATRDLARARTALRGLGARPRRHTARPTFGWESLTPTESRVVELVAAGLTNPQIAEQLYVSRRTVATHVEHVFQKLGHSNRVELAAEAARRTSTAG